jgi:hypothetical protein
MAILNFQRKPDSKPTTNKRMMLKTLEGYLENDRFYPSGKAMSVQGRRKVLVTILDEPEPTKEEKLRAWAEIRKFISEMTDEEKPRWEDFPRLKISRKLVDFGEVQ